MPYIAATRARFSPEGASATPRATACSVPTRSPRLLRHLETLAPPRDLKFRNVGLSLSGFHVNCIRPRYNDGRTGVAAGPPDGFVPPADELGLLVNFGVARVFEDRPPAKRCGGGDHRVELGFNGAEQGGLTSRGQR